MDNNKLNYTYDNIIQVDENTVTRKFMANVFLWMFLALGISALCAFEAAFNPSVRDVIYDATTGQRTGLGTLTIFAPFAFIMVMGLGLQKLAYPILVVLFIAFAAVMGVGLSSIFLQYTINAILGVFASTSVLFAVMAIAGYTTQTDLTKFGSLMMMGLVGIIIASVVNWFLQSNQLDYIISFVGVAVFIGLTAYDVQKLKQIAATEDIDGTLKSKLGLMGALSLYLDFVNLFLMLLRLFGGGRGRN
ncbi:MAG: Bax inhibitor-1/YccA family protein [Mucilaginibacter sp.]|uniref:Bax inhibitor-1/YccA family protein n=1 Tax=Mucilaginibacter sp. TaxID=1882438 RepID=UPI003267697F